MNEGTRSGKSAIRLLGISAERPTNGLYLYLFLRTPGRLTQSVTQPKFVRKVPESNICSITGYPKVFRVFL
jgi:hypothetical protein